MTAAAFVEGSCSLYAGFDRKSATRSRILQDATPLTSVVRVADQLAAEPCGEFSEADRHWNQLS